MQLYTFSPPQFCAVTIDTSGRCEIILSVAGGTGNGKLLGLTASQAPDSCPSRRAIKR